MTENVTSSGFSLLEYLDSIAVILRDSTDPRTSQWFLVDSFYTIFLIIVGYVIICLQIGPRLMKNREAFELKTPMVVYNALNVMISAYIVYEGCQAGWLRDYSFKCQPVDFSDSPEALRVARVVWLYYMVKLFDMADTIFFILRKKQSQVTFLHVYHHGLMPLVGYIAIRFLPGGHGTLLGLINSAVHVIMYSYYMLTALGPAYKKYLWWKRYITVIQLIQFVVVFLHLTQVFYRECDYPKFPVFLCSINVLLMIYLFGRFYYKTYCKPKTSYYKPKTS